MSKGEKNRNEVRSINNGGHLVCNFLSCIKDSEFFSLVE